MNPKSLFIAVASVLSVVASPKAGAQAKDTSSLGPVVLSATKVPSPAATLSQAVTVLLGDDLRARGVTRVTDALREVPGASIVRTVSARGLTSISSRGGESRYTKVLIDGVPVN